MQRNQELQDQILLREGNVFSFFYNKTPKGIYRISVFMELMPIIAPLFAINLIVLIMSGNLNSFLQGLFILFLIGYGLFLLDLTGNFKRGYDVALSVDMDNLYIINYSTSGIRRKCIPIAQIKDIKCDNAISIYSFMPDKYDISLAEVSVITEETTFKLDMQKISPAYALLCDLHETLAKIAPKYL